MRAAFFTFFTLLLSGSNSSGFDTNQSSEVAPKLINLNSDVLYMILYNLEIHELLHTAEAFPELSNIIGEVFRRKFLKNQTIVNLWITDRSDYYGTNFRSVAFIYNTIRVNGCDDSINMLKHFGRFFQNVRIHYKTTNSSDVKIINRSINKYCSDALKQLDVTFVHLDDFKQFTTPFEGVEEFSISVTENGLKVSKPLYELFPNLQQLNLKLGGSININFINGTFPHLNHFHLNVDMSINSRKRAAFIEQLKEMILKNPRIRSTGMLFDYPPDFLEFLNEALPNLEHLKLNNLEIDRTDSVQFQNVKKFDLNPYHTVTTIDLEKLSLPNLESLEGCDLSDHFDKWIQFFRRHTHLRQLHIIDDTILLNSIHSNGLLVVIPNVVDLTININFCYGFEPIARFIRKCRQFEKVHFIFREMPIATNDVTALQQQFQNEWTVEGGRSNDAIKSLTFERKQPVQE